MQQLQRKGPTGAKKLNPHDMTLRNIEHQSFLSCDA
jgi:hypothetical protein